MNTLEVLLKYRWVSCSKDLSWDISRYRHLMSKNKGAVTTLCGATGLGERTWRDDSRKPGCEKCTSRALELAGV